MLYKDGKMAHWGWPADVHRGDFPDAHLMRRIKLHLQPKRLHEGSMFDPSTAAPLPPGVDVLQVISDYLRALKDFIFRHIHALK